jgi:hypothetical protein
MMRATGTSREPVTAAATEWMPPAPGRLLADRYRLIEQVGQGGTSVVWRAHDDVLDRPVAVKMLSCVDDAPLRRRLRNEARACGRLNHPRIAQVFDYGETGTAGTEVTPYIVMELVDGEPLSHRLSDGAAFGWMAAASIAGHVADGLRAAHACGLVHRDVKPSNIMLTRHGVKLVDFGICAAVGSPDSDEDGRVRGTPAYLAPERLVDAPVDAATDVYALGVLLYRMLAGVLPWPASTRTELIDAHMWTEPAPLPPIEGMPTCVADLCVACMDKQPHQRPSSAEAAQVLAQFSRGTSAAFVSGNGGVGGAVDDLGEVAAGGADVDGHDARTRAWPSLVHAPTPGYTQRRRRMFVLVVAVMSVMLLGTAWASGGTPARATNTGDSTRCGAAFSVLRDWGTGFTAALTMTNTGPVGLHVEQLTFAFPGTQNLQPDPRTGAQTTATATDGPAYLVMMAQSGTTVTARADTQQLVLQPGAAVTVAIHATYRGANPLPMVFNLNGQVCQARVAGASNPTPSSSPASKPTRPRPTGAPAPGGHTPGHADRHPHEQGKPAKHKGAG